METARGLLVAAFYTLSWGGWMLLWETRRRKSANLKPALLPASIAIWTLVGLSFGLFMAFHSKSFPWPLRLIAAASFIAGCLVSAIYRAERIEAFPQRQSWQRTVSFFLVMGGLAALLLDAPTPIAALSFVAAGVLYASEYFQSKDRPSAALIE